MFEARRRVLQAGNLLCYQKWGYAFIFSFLLPSETISIAFGNRAFGTEGLICNARCQSEGLFGGHRCVQIEDINKTLFGSRVYVREGFFMSQIGVSNLTFCYEGSFDNIFDNVSFSIDTEWKLGFIGRNGKGKTTFLNLLQGKMEYQGTISASIVFDYFPYQVSERSRKVCWGEILEEIRPECELWRVICELDKLQVSAEVLYRPFETLSHGERTKIMLAILFSQDNYFLLIDEPTNHLDREARELVKEYLCGKKGFILVSHDRDLLDACIDHVLVLNRRSIEVQSGSFSSWWENKTRMDAFRRAENEKHRREIKTLRQAANRTQRWAESNERTKIGFDPIKDHDRCTATRAYIGAKTKKMQSRVKNLEV